MSKEAPKTYYCEFKSLNQKRPVEVSEMTCVSDCSYPLARLRDGCAYINSLTPEKRKDILGDLMVLTIKRAMNIRNIRRMRILSKSTRNDI